MQKTGSGEQDLFLYHVENGAFVNATQKSLSDLGVDVIGGTPEDFAAYIKSEIPKWTAIIKASGAKLD